MIRTSDYAEIMMRTVGQGEKLIRLFIIAPYVVMDAEYLNLIHMSSGAEILVQDLRLGELMLIETDRQIIVLEQRKGFYNVDSHPAIDKLKVAVS